MNDDFSEVRKRAARAISVGSPTGADARTGSVSGVTAVDIEDMAGDE
jgi:hypothetical protein